MEQELERIRDYISHHRQDMLRLWEELVNTESGPQQKEGVEMVIGILRREMAVSGIQSQVLPMGKAGSLLIGSWGEPGDRPPFLLIGHTDTVFAPGAAQETPFRIDPEGRAHGPGCLDMKGGLVIALYAAKALAAIGWRGRPLKFILAGDEETMHMSSGAKQAMADEMAGAVAAFNFETGYPDGQVVIGRMGGGIAQIEISGVAAHSGLAPEKGRSAILEAARIVMELEALNDIPRGKLINCGLIQGGLGENTIPDACTINIGYRFPSEAIDREISQAINAAVTRHFVEGTQIRRIQKMHIDCMETTPGVSQLYEHLCQTALACELEPPQALRVNGGSDSSIAVSAGIPTVCGMGVRGEFNHTDQEYAQVESLFERCLLAACAIRRLDW